jgi:hypothetical protein
MAVKGGGGVRGEGQRYDVEVVAGGGSGVELGVRRRVGDDAQHRR